MARFAGGFPAMLDSLWFYRSQLKNWPAVSWSRWRKTPVRELRLRDGHVISFLDPHAEVWAFHSIYGQQCYDADFPGIPPDGTVIDLGANVGIFTMYAATKLVPSGKVLALEPSPACAKVLRRNVSRCANVQVIEAAVAGSGELWLTEDSLGSSIFEAHDAIRKIAVQAVCSEAILNYFARISLLKANIEGAEYPFVLDTSDALWTKVERAAIKWHDGDVSHGHKPEEILERLAKRGFRILRHEYIWRSDGYHLRGPRLSLVTIRSHSW